MVERKVRTESECGGGDERGFCNIMQSSKVFKNGKKKRRLKRSREAAVKGRYLRETNNDSRELRKWMRGERR